MALFRQKALPRIHCLPSGNFIASEHGHRNIVLIDLPIKNCDFPAIIVDLPIKNCAFPSFFPMSIHWFRAFCRQAKPPMIFQLLHPWKVFHLWRTPMGAQSKGNVGLYEIQSCGKPNL